MKDKIIVNGQEVEYFHIDKKLDGTTIITISKEFDVVTAHTSDIMKKIRADGYECHVFRDLKHGIISIWLQDMSDAFGVLNALEIPSDKYEVIDEELNIICVQIGNLPYYQFKMDNTGRITGWEECKV